MADFDVPFGQDSERRFPTSTEVQNGFPCGPADQSLFNGLFWQLQAELKAIHDEAGIAGDNSTSSTTVDAILALIAAATGGNPAGYVLMTQARSRLPIFPEVLNTDGRIVVTAPSTGTVRLPGGVDFLHRGIFNVTTAQTDFLTDPSKIYHLRWDQVNGFRLIDLASGTYNPTGLVETNPVFDSTYDDMLIARVITNSSNVATITNLSNKQTMLVGATHVGPGAFADSTKPLPNLVGFELAEPSMIQNFLPVSVNLARRPQVSISAVHDLRMSDVFIAGAASERNFGVDARSRYVVAAYAQGESNIMLTWSGRA